MRLFVAVWPPDCLIGQLAMLDRPEGAGVRWTTRDQWHVTLRFLGEVADVEAARHALKTVCPGPATAVAGPGLQRLGPSVLCVPVAGLDALAGDVIGATTGMGAWDDRPFRGHLTVARGRRGVDLGPLPSVAVVATWPVEEFTLVASRLHPEGARYEVLARYPVEMS